MEINGYVPLVLLVDGPNKKKEAKHVIFCRKHESQKGRHSSSAVFVSGLPLDVTRKNIKDLCQTLGGAIMSSFNLTGPRHGLISLVDDAACDMFVSHMLQRAKHSKPIKWKNYNKRGDEALFSLYEPQFPPEGELQHQVDEYMETYEAREQEREAAGAAKDEVDEDGFIKVSGTKRKSTDSAKPLPEFTSSKKKKKLEHEDFYRYQIRESKKIETLKLLEKHQQDRERIEAARKTGAFCPQ